ncbi:MAG: ISAs1 family transposase [Chloroflexota bacterium]|nr:ISAs1 family transposase [Chloroflexota bacterium]
MDRTQSTTLMEVLTQVPDYRKRKGRQHRWLTLLSLIAAAMASAQHTPQAIARWVREQRADRFAALPPTVSRLPSGSTIRRTLARLDVTALETALAAFQPPAAPVPTPMLPAAPVPTPPAPIPFQGLALDGNAVRGVGRAGHPCHLVALVQHGNARVLGHVEVAHKRDERSAVPELLHGRALAGTVLPADALHTLRPTARHIRAQNGHYLMIVKKTQAALDTYLDMLFTLPAHPADHEVWDTVGPTTEKGHGRRETRRLTCGNAHIADVDWPDVRHVVRRECERRMLKTGKRTCEVTYGLVSLPPEEAGAATIAALWRGHWTIDNRLHYVRDGSLSEDAGHAAQGTTAHALAALRTGLLMLFRQAHWSSVPDALAQYGASVARACALIGREVKTETALLIARAEVKPAICPQMHATDRRL